MPPKRVPRPTSRGRATPSADEHPSIGAISFDELYRGHKRLELCRDLALSELSHRELAHREGVATADIAAFAQDHQTEIAEVRAALAGQLAIETAGLWISKKQNRLAEYQAEIEEIRDYLAELRGAGISWSRAHRDMLKMYMDMFRQTADELGAYPQRAQAPARTGQTVHYIIDTANPEALT
jgi:hypothetical protein